MVTWNLFYMVKKKNVVEGDVISIDHEQEPIKNACAIQLFIQCAVLEP